MLLASFGSAAALQAVLDAGEAELEARNEDGYTAFLWACCKGHAECIALLAQAGCNTRAKNEKGSTGLILAAASGSATAVQAVLDACEAELEARNQDEYCKS